jgi:hypothetical protein
MLKDELNANKQRPVHIWKMVPAIFTRDPGCVLHGVFLERLDGRIRLPRLVSAYIEAYSPNQANSGGVYRGEVTAKDNIPYPRQEFTSTGITASFIVHLSTLKGYCLDEPKRRFLQSWALYKIDRFLNDYLRLRTACEFEVAGVLVTVDGNPADLGNGSGRWPRASDITTAFTAARDICFPRHSEGDEWAQRRVSVVTYAVDVVVKESLPDGITPEAMNLAGFTDRAEVKLVTEGKGAKKKTYTALILKGEWPEEDQTTLIAQNPEKRDTDGGEEEDNPAHDVVKKALKKWNDAWKKVQKKMTGTEEAEVQE